MKKRITLLTAGILCAVSLGVGVAAPLAVEKIEAELRRDFTIKVDGEVKEFKNVNGEVVYPVLYEGTTYLPLRAIGELMGKTVYWYEDDKRVELKEEKSTVTDADVIVYDKDKPKKDNQTEKSDKADDGEAQSRFIGEDAAQKIALEKAGLTKNDIDYIKIKLDNDNGLWHYEIEFKKGLTEYEADIDARNGEILVWETEKYD